MRPTIAALDGVHAHDDLLEDLGRPAIEADLRALSGFARRLAEIDPAGLTEVEHAEHPVLADHIKARMFELEEVADLGAQPAALRRHASPRAWRRRRCSRSRRPTERARRVLSKLRQVPATHSGGPRQHQGPARHLRQGRHRDASTARCAFIEHDLPRAFRDVDDLHLLGDLADASTEAAQRDPRLRGVRSRPNWRRRRARRSGWAARSSSRSCGSRKASASASIGCWRSPSASWPTTQEAFRTRRRQAEWRRSRGGVGEGQGEAPGARASSSTRRSSSSTSSQTFLERQKLLTLPASEPVVVAPTPDFFRWSCASMWTPGPFETKPSRAYYYLTDVERGWSARAAGRAPARLQLRHALVHLDPRGVSRPLPAVPAPAPGGVEGAQVDLLRAGDLRRRLGALLRADDAGGGLRPEGSARPARTAAGSAHPPRALRRRRSGCTPRICRSSRACGCSASDAFLEEANARREAERGTFDPTYLVYSVGKLMLQKLRQDVKTRRATASRCARSTTRCSKQGAAPFCAASPADARRRPGAVLD